jgi:hypothetical protein
MLLQYSVYLVSSERFLGVCVRLHVMSTMTAAQHSDLLRHAGAPGYIADCIKNGALGIGRE